jgi:hypothetical protein
VLQSSKRKNQMVLSFRHIRSFWCLYIVAHIWGDGIDTRTDYRQKCGLVLIHCSSSTSSPHSDLSKRLAAMSATSRCYIPM